MNHKIVELKKMTAITFQGTGAECEMEAFGKMKEWLEDNPAAGKFRVFGYNTDSKGILTIEPQHEGYKVLVVQENEGDFKGMKTEVIAPGRFLVIRAEGEMRNVMEWLPAGWMNLNQAVQENELKIKMPPRWYEEHVRTDSPDYMIVDLHLELDE